MLVRQLSAFHLSLKKNRTLVECTLLCSLTHHLCRSRHSFVLTTCFILVTHYIILVHIFSLIPLPLAPVTTNSGCPTVIPMPKGTSRTLKMIPSLSTPKPTPKKATKSNKENSGATDDTKKARAVVL